MHFLALGTALSGDASLDGFLAWTDRPWVKASEVAVVALLAAHLTGGLRLLLIEFTRLAARIAGNVARRRRRCRRVLRAGIRAQFVLKPVSRYGNAMRIDPKTIENVAKELYIRALKILPPDVKRGFDALAAKETAPTAQNVLGTMIKNISVAEATDNLSARTRESRSTT